MNVITWKFAYSLYPKATFEDRRTLICCDDGPHQPSAELKYESRGWRLERSLDANDLAFHIGVRVLGDRYTWRIPLDVSRVIPPFPLSRSGRRLTTDPIAATTWKLLLFGPQRDRPHLSFVTLKARFLKYHYICADSVAIFLAMSSVEDGVATE